MTEKVSPAHPDKMADRIAGAIVDMAYDMEEEPEISAEVFIANGTCHVVVKSSVAEGYEEGCVKDVLERLVPELHFDIDVTKAEAERYETLCCDDNGIFRGYPLTEEEKSLSKTARDIYKKYPTNGKYLLDGKRLVILVSGVRAEKIQKMYPEALINPTGFLESDIRKKTGMTNRKLGSDLGKSVTGAGIHGKSVRNADVCVSIYAFLKAQETGKSIEIACAKGDRKVDGIPYADIVSIAKGYVSFLGGFERLAEWGLW